MGEAGAFENAVEEVTFELRGDGGIGVFKIVASLGGREREEPPLVLCVVWGAWWTPHLADAGVGPCSQCSGKPRLSCCRRGAVLQLD